MENDNTATSNITLQDMVTMVNIIDVSAERGSYKGNELAVVGQLREKLAAFVKQHQPAPDAQAEETVEDAE
jgi:hypothetical protein